MSNTLLTSEAQQTNRAAPTNETNVVTRKGSAQQTTSAPLQAVDRFELLVEKLCAALRGTGTLSPEDAALFRAEAAKFATFDQLNSKKEKARAHLAAAVAIPANFPHKPFRFGSCSPDSFSKELLDSAVRVICKEKAYWVPCARRYLYATIWRLAAVNVEARATLGPNIYLDIAEEARTIAAPMRLDWAGSPLLHQKQVDLFISAAHANSSPSHEHGIILALHYICVFYQQGFPGDVMDLITLQDMTSSLPTTFAPKPLP